MTTIMFCEECGHRMVLEGAEEAVLVVCGYCNGEMREEIHGGGRDGDS